MNTKIRLLCVEDEADIRSIIAVVFEDEPDFELLLCATGAEALATAPGFRPTILLLDVMMPGMDGPTTLRNLRALPGLSDTPAAFLTAKVQPSEVARFRALGAIGVVAKPFDPITLPSAIRQLWSQQHGK